MKRYIQLKEKEILSRLSKDLKVWDGEIGKSKLRTIKKGSLVKTIDEYKDKKYGIVRILDYNNTLFYVLENDFYESL